MKKFEAILFDMDGTLLPMDLDPFMRGYLKLLSEPVAPLGSDPKTLSPAMWEGVEKMVQSDGTKTNAEVFWAEFANHFGEKVYADVPHFDAFYRTEFAKAAVLTQPTPLAKEAVRLARAVADKLILATNPIFPAAALHERLRWAGLSPADFDYITDYENSHFCKPNPKYYLEIADKCGFAPQNALMIGNNADEDAAACMAAGMPAYLVTDCLIAKGEVPDCPATSLAELCTFLQK